MIGSFGAVFKARDPNSPDPDAYVALKNVVVNLQRGIDTSIIREVPIMRRMSTLRHPNVVRMLDVCIGKYKPSDRVLQLYIVLEYMDSDLFNVIRKGPLTDDRRKVCHMACLVQTFLLQARLLI